MTKISHLTAAFLLNAIGPLFAEEMNDADPSTPAVPVPVAAIKQTERKSFLEWHYFTGDWGGLRTRLADKGVELGAEYYAEVWGNTTGGLKRGAVYTGLMLLEAHLDFNKLVGWEGASFYTRWLWLSGRDASEDLAGNFLTISYIAGFNTFRNLELWFQQNLFDDKISIRVGQLAADSEFVISDYGSVLINAAFGWPAFIYMNIPNGGPGYPMGAPAVRLALNPSKDFTFLAAVFQGDVFAQNVNRHGFDWNLNASNGYFWMTEAQWRHDFWLPGQIKVGAWFHTADFPNADGSDSSYWGNYGIYFIADQMIYREESPAASVLSKDGNSVASKEAASDDEAQGFGLFARLAFDPQDRNFVGFYAEGGFNYKGLIPTRDNDILGAGIGYAQLTNGAKDVLASEGSVNPDYEIVIEATYQAQITPWLVLQPDLQYIIHPGGTRDFGNALILGGRVVVTF